MSELQFYIVDVFAEKKFLGNQLAVFRNVGDLDGDTMQAIAQEMNYSETTFIKSDEPSKCGFDTRIFTPKEELPFAGHPTLGTAYIINSKILKEPSENIDLCLPVGSIPVKADHTRGENFLWMRQNEPEFIGELDAEIAAELLSLEVEEIDDRFPVMEVSTGSPDIIIPLKRLHAVKRARINREFYYDLIEKIESKAVYLFAPETDNPDNQIHARMFADYFGVSEDPATGSAAGCLAGYLVHNKFFGRDKVELKIEQGAEIGRDSILYLDAQAKDDKIEINVGGKVQMVAKGKLYL